VAYKFKRNIAIRILDNGRIVIGGGRFAKSIEDTEGNRLLLRGISEGASSAEIAQSMYSIDSAISEAAIDAALTSLARANLVEQNDSTAELDEPRLSRQELFFSLYSTDQAFPSECAEQLSAARVLILGCGGVGSMTALNLAAVGVGVLRIVDFDTVDATNLNRSFIFHPDDIGRPKIEVLEERLPPQFPDTHFEFVGARVAGVSDVEPLLRGMTFGVLAADAPYLKVNRWFNQACLDSKTPYTLAGCSESFGSVGPMTVPGQTSCFECQGFDMTDIGEGPDFMVRTNSKRKAPSFAPLISTVASLNSLEIVKHLTQFERPQTYNSQLRFEFDTMELIKVERFSDGPCSCGSPSAVEMVLAQ